jgi:uncharacterized protein YlzI (FlbEa/FlbD family)
MDPGEKIMFFVRGLSSNGKEVFVNPDQVLYVCPAARLRHKTMLVLTYGERLRVDQDTETVQQRFEDYLKDIVDTEKEPALAGEDSAKAGQRSNQTRVLS